MDKKLDLIKATRQLRSNRPIDQNANKIFKFSETHKSITNHTT